MPVTEQPVRCEVVDGVAWLTIDRPEARNALNKAVRDGLFAGAHRFNADGEAKVLVRGAPWAAPLSWLIPPRAAMEILLTGDLIDAERAERIGLVNRVVPDAELRDKTQQLARRIASNAPLSVLAAKKTVRLVAEYPLSAAFQEAERIWAPVYTSQDAQEGPAAFRDRRAPAWKGC